jgi:hypothetical protein
LNFDFFSGAACAIVGHGEKSEKAAQAQGQVGFQSKRVAGCGTSHEG